jgi:hypothetical protein
LKAGQVNPFEIETSLQKREAELNNKGVEIEEWNVRKLNQLDLLNGMC